MDLRALGQREARVVLREDLAEQLHGREQLLRREMLVAQHQHGVIHEGAVQPSAQPRIDRL